MGILAINERNCGEYGGGARYEYESDGCGCCSGMVPLDLETCKQYIVHLEEQLILAKVALADMEENGEDYPRKYE